MALGFGGKMPHQWFGVTTADLVGWAIVLFLPVLFLVLQIVILDRQRQLKKDLAWIAWRLGAPKVERDKVVPLRRGSG
jgi:hypothetical protein